MTRCEVIIPGIGQCELDDHKLDGVGRQVHVLGPVTWNGGIVIEVSDKALDEAARRDPRLSVPVSNRYCLPCDEFHEGDCPNRPPA